MRMCTWANKARQTFTRDDPKGTLNEHCLYNVYLIHQLTHRLCVVYLIHQVTVTSFMWCLSYLPADTLLFCCLPYPPGNSHIVYMSFILFTRWRSGEWAGRPDGHAHIIHEISQLCGKKTSQAESRMERREAIPGKTLSIWDCVL